jgi:signal peptidase II
VDIGVKAFQFTSSVSTTVSGRLKVNKPILTRAALYGLILAAGIAGIDQASKAWVLYGLHLADRGTVEVLPFFSLTLERNYSMSFGLLGTSALARLFLLVFPFVAAAVGVYVLRRVTPQRKGLALGLIIGGALGNGFDRIRLGWVVDFLDFSRLAFPWIFNVADSAITIGVLILLYHYVLDGKSSDTVDAKI